MKVQIFILTTVLISYFQYTMSMKFYTDIKPSSLKCVGEYLIENTLALFSIKNGNTENVVRLLDPNGNTVYKKENLDVVKLAYTAKDSGNHQLCIHNNIDKTQRIEIEILTGVAAQDYSSIAKQSNLKPMELNLKKLDDALNYLLRELTSIIKKEETSLELNDSLSNKIVLFSMITLGAMLFLGLLETVYIQKYLERKKLI